MSQGNEMDFASITLSRLLFVPVTSPYIYEPTQMAQTTPVNMIFTLKGELPAQARSTAEFRKLASVSNTVEKTSKAMVGVPFFA